MKEEMMIIIRVNEEAENFYGRSTALGDLAADMIGEHRRSQLTSLENIANSTLKTTDVLDYVKKQIGRDRGWSSSRNPQNTSFGERLKTELESTLKSAAEGICREMGINGDTEEHRRKRQHVYLLLIRQFIRQLVVQYEYKIGEKKEAAQHGNRRTTT